MIKKLLPILLLVALLSHLHLSAQEKQNGLINSGKVISEGKILYDSGKYDEAILKYKSIPKRDTNYVFMLSELALAYIADSAYTDAVAICEEGLSNASEYKNHLLKSKAIALDKGGNYPQAVKVFNEAIDAYPFDHSMYFNLGITYYNHKEYAKAEESFFKAVSINPFHSTSHLNLANLAVSQGRRTHAMLSMGIYLSLRNTDNARLVFMNRFLGNELDESNLIAPIGMNSCENMDKLIKSKLALDQQFKAKIPLNAAISRQYEFFFQQVESLPTSTDDKYLNYYLAFYRDIKSKGYDQTLLYHMLKSTPNEDIKKWIKKNEKSINAFFGVANTSLKENRKLLLVPSKFNFKDKVQAWFYSDNQLEAIGNKVNDKNQGSWYFFSGNYEVSASGSYKDGVKTGTWNYYYRNGHKKSIENYDTGEIHFFYEDGGLRNHYYLKNDEIDGVVDIFYPCGDIKEKVSYKEGKRQGSGFVNYVNGSKMLDYIYDNNELTGEYIRYYPTGQVEFRQTYKTGLEEGKSLEYFSNGVLQADGSFKNGEKDGPWKIFFSNGKLKNQGTYVNGLPVGEWLYYDHNGSLTEKRNFDEKGDWQGANTIYYDGKVHMIREFSKDLLIKITTYNESGEAIFTAGDSKGNFHSKAYYFSGALAGEGEIKNGKMSGLWTHYYPEGIKWKEYNYVDGNEEGEGVEYFRNGNKKFVTHYKEGVTDGKFEEFFVHGVKKQEGYYSEGMRQQQWLAYYSNGKVENDFYYLNDELKDNYDEYNALGHHYSSTWYKGEFITKVISLNRAGENVVKTKTNGSITTYSAKFKNDTSRYINRIKCGYYDGELKYKFSNGKTYYAYNFINGKKYGKYESYSPYGTQTAIGHYEDGNETGWWKYYNSVGKIDSEGKYFDGDRDSVWTFYYDNGKISSSAIYFNGNKEGITQYFDLEGRVFLEKKYEGGHLVSYRILNEEKKGTWTSMSKNFTIDVKYPNGQPLWHEDYKNGTVSGSKKIYYPSGKLYSETKFIDGDYNGDYTLHYENGKMAESGSYLNDELNGIRTYYSVQGDKIFSSEFLCDYLNGKTIIYVKNEPKLQFGFWGGINEY